MDAQGSDERAKSLAWWPFDDDPIDGNNGAVVTGKAISQRTAKLHDGAVVTPFGKFGQGLKFYRNDYRSRMTIQDNGVDLGNNWTLTAWAKNLLPPAANSRSTLYRGQDFREGVIMTGIW